MIILLVFIFGLIVGSFLNVVIYRLKTRERIVSGRSHCPHCKHDLGVIDLIPVISFILQRGRCRYCNKKISWQYPAVELIAGILFTTSILVYSSGHDLWLNFQFLLLIASNWIFIAILIIIFVYDLKWYLILDKVTIPAMIVALVLNLWLGVPWWSLLLAAVIGLGFFGIQFIISRGKWIGGGDLRLGFLMGLMLGWPNILVALFLAYIIGSIFGIFLIIFGKKGPKSQIPFGTFLSIATIIALLWGSELVGWYLGFIGL